MIAFDCETWLVAPGRLAPRLVCLSWSDGTTTELLDRTAALVWFREQLGSRTALCGHNVAYDAAVMVQADPTLMPLVWAHYDAGLFVDTQLCDQLRHIARGWYRIEPRTGKQPRFTLAALAERHLGIKLEGKTADDSWRFRYRELDGVPLADWPPPAVEYARTDALTTWRVWDKIGTATPVDLDAQARSAWSLHLVSAWGLRTDLAQLSTLKAKLEARVSAASEQLQTAGILRADGTKDTKAVRARVLAALGQAAPKTAKGSISTARDVLASTGDPDLELLASISNDSKLLTTYLPVLERGTTRPICPQYWLVESGRTSARGPNIQNQPRFGGVRECWIPRDGWVYVACDYHVAELCALAQVCLDWFGSSRMAEALNAGHDLHVVTAATILGIPYAEAVERYATGDKEVKQARQLAKAANFGFPGGLGAASFCDFARATYGVELNESAARKLKAQWLKAYPEMRQYFSRISASCGFGGSFSAVQVRSGRVRGGVGYCDGSNTYFQGLIADGARAATYQAVKAQYTRGDPLEGCRTVAFVHDEIILEAPADRAPAAAARLSEIMVASMRAYLPALNVRATPHLMARWYKDAEPVFSQGVLVPWIP